jgi:CheY-like chemotaxis protein
LVADDVVANRAVLVDLLQPLGFAVVEAVNGREAVEKARDVRPDLIITDVVMPEMDGREAMRRIKALEGLSGVPVILVSASVEAETSLSGADAFLRKPIDTEELLRNIGVLLSVEWIYAVPEEELESVVAGRRLEQLLAPPMAELQVLHTLAREGDMRQIIRWAERVSDLDERYVRFTEQVRRLARQYQSRSVLRLVEQHLGGAE